MILIAVNYISNNKQNIVEGQLRCKELSEYLEKLKAPRAVWLSEDGSGIVSKVSFDSTTNQMVGLVLPIDPEKGIPIPFTFTPNSVDEIESQLKKPKATHIYMILAQSLKENVPPFVLAVYGVDNTFTVENVMKRWKHTQKELTK